MTEQPDPSAFSRNEREQDYTAYIEVRGTISIGIKANSAEDARRQAEAEVRRMDADGYVEVDRIEELELQRMVKDPPMFLVTRDGQQMRVSRLDPGDAPRAPDERGF
jgi:hypothetical protein